MWFKHLFAMYTGLPNASENLRTIIDFFYHYQTEVGIFNEIQFKKITYGEYIEQTRRLPNEKLYNAFIMPYNKENNLFMLNSNFGNIGEAVSDWKPNVKNYERIQGIVVDTRYLMYNYIGTSDQQKKEMAVCIEKVLIRGPVPASSI
jgi:hypothetical protein